MTQVEVVTDQIMNTILYYRDEYERELAVDEAAAMIAEGYQKCSLDKDNRVRDFMTENDVCREHAVDELNQMSQDEFLGMARGGPDRD